MEAGVVLADAGFDAPSSLLALEGLDRDRASAVYLSGSIAEGFANRASDVDVYVVGEREPRSELTIRKSRFSIAIHFHGRRRVDFEYWPRGEALRIARKLRTVRPGREFVAEKLDPVEELFVHRVFVGLPLANAHLVEDLRAQFDLELFRAYLAQQAVHRVDGALEDLAGMVEDGDLDVAIFRARDLVGLVADACCHHLGNTNTLVKWRPKILERLPGSPLADEVRRQFWALAVPEPSIVTSRSAAEAYVERCIRFAHETTIAMQG